jgi:hypothetical protein
VVNSPSRFAAADSLSSSGITRPLLLAPLVTPVVIVASEASVLALGIASASVTISYVPEGIPQKPKLPLMSVVVVPTTFSTSAVVGLVVGAFGSPTV